MKMKLLLAVITVMLLVCAQCEAKTFSLCGLVRELRKQNFPEHEMRDWVCLVEKESSRRTHVIGPPNDDGSRDHGLFQINDHYWCNDSNVPGKGCHVTCQQMRTDDITAASTCAKKIYRRHGFNAWYGWVNHCRGKALPDISHC